MLFDLLQRKRTHFVHWRAKTRLAARMGRPEADLSVGGQGLRVDLRISPAVRAASDFGQEQAVGNRRPCSQDAIFPAAASA
jgi:hypothetical protein